MNRSLLRLELHKHAVWQIYTSTYSMEKPNTLSTYFKKGSCSVFIRERQREIERNGENKTARGTVASQHHWGTSQMATLSNCRKDAKPSVENIDNFTRKDVCFLKPTGFKKQTCFYFLPTGDTIHLCRNPSSRIVSAREETRLMILPHCFTSMGCFGDYRRQHTEMPLLLVARCNRTCPHLDLSHSCHLLLAAMVAGKGVELGVQYCIFGTRCLYTDLRQPVALRSTWEECSCSLWSSWWGDVSQAERGMITVLVSTARASWIMGIFSASHDDRFHSTPAGGERDHDPLSSSHPILFLTCSYVLQVRCNHEITTP